MFASGSFHESVSPQPQSIPLRPFRIFSKICGDNRSSRFATGAAPVAMEKIFNQKNFNNCIWSPLGSRGNIDINVNDTGGIFATMSTTQGELVAKFTAGVVDTGGKFAIGVVDTGGAP